MGIVSRVVCFDTQCGTEKSEHQGGTLRNLSEKRFRLKRWVLQLETVLRVVYVYTTQHGEVGAYGYTTRHGKVGATRRSRSHWGGTRWNLDEKRYREKRRMLHHVREVIPMRVPLSSVDGGRSITPPPSSAQRDASGARSVTPAERAAASKWEASASASGTSAECQRNDS